MYEYSLILNNNTQYINIVPLNNELIKTDKAGIKDSWRMHNKYYVKSYCANWRGDIDSIWYMSYFEWYNKSTATVQVLPEFSFTYVSEDTYDVT